MSLKKEFIIISAIILLLLGLIIFINSQKGKSYSQNVTLYSSDGKEIRRWVSKGAVYCNNNTFQFYDKYTESENMVQISGTVIVE
jgi:hypothetical protein